MRLALIGDVGGHRDLLVDVLDRLGVDLDTPTMPGDLTIIQVGDLIDRGPDSPGCVEVAAAMMTRWPDQWIQLLGNHEGNRLGGPAFWDEGLEREAEATLLDWWSERRAALAVALRTTEFGDVLVSHGGLTATLWHVLGKPPLADVAP
ncbi:MAG TPA: metallophosphoesterase, partial [Acidimicrobiales bacterium]